MPESEVGKNSIHITAGIIDYSGNAVVSRTIVQKVTGSIIVSALDAGQELIEKTLPYDKYLQIVDGEAEVIINEKSFNLKTGECILIRAHAPHTVRAARPFKMVSTVIKSGYED